MPFPRFEGNCPRNVGKDAKYAVRHKDGKLVVGLVYNAGDGERWRATTEEHPQLVEMVNAVKTEMAGAGAPGVAPRPGGPFYINEYGQVIVPVAGTRDYFLAGEYQQPLRFDFEGKILSGEPIDAAGKRFAPGDPWESKPLPGIPYQLAANGHDIYYDLELRPDVTKRTLLSVTAGREGAAMMAKKIASQKGHLGGRFYVNEWRALFTPKTKDDDLMRVYIGQLEENDPWFPKAHTS